MTFFPRRVPISEQLLLDSLAPLTLDPPRQVLCTSLGRGQLAAGMTRRWPGSAVLCHFLDLYLADQARLWLQTADAPVTVDCSTDFPEGDVDLVAIPCRAQGDGELTRDLLQSGVQRLRLGGRLLAATDNRSDTWLGELLKRLVQKISRTETKKGVVYSGVKTEPLRKVKDYSCEFAFRDQGRLIRAFSRPGVFSHRRLDLGARALIESLDLPAGAKFLDLGCGSGVVSLAAALRADNVEVVAVDANPRAVECTERGAELNGVTRIATRLSADASSPAPGTFTHVAANPPYYSQFRIGELFVQGAEQALDRGGVLQLVTKQPDAYLKLVQAGFHQATVTAARQYSIVRAVRN